jgi:hypothetical protein
MSNGFVPVDSSIIKEVQYNQGDRTLLIRFVKGSLYKYTGVTQDMYEEMMYGESIGKYFHRNIKQLATTKLEE